MLQLPIPDESQGHPQLPSGGMHEGGGSPCRKGGDKGSMRKASAGTQARMKSLFNLMFDYAYKRELVDRYYARAFEVGREVKEQRQKEKRENYIFSSVGEHGLPAPRYSGAFLGVRVRLSGRVPRVAYAPRRVKIAQPEGFARCRRKGGGVFYGNCKGWLESQGIAQGMGKAGRPYGNAPMERFYKTFKHELVYRHHFYECKSIGWCGSAICICLAQPCQAAFVQQLDGAI